MPRSNRSSRRPGRGDQHVDALVQGRDLVAHGHAADQQHPAQLGALGVFREALGDLVGQFAGRGQHQGARHAGAGAALGQAVDQGQGEGGGLAGAGLGDAQDVASGEGDGNGLGLNGGGGRVAGIGDRLQGRGREAQCGEFGHVSLGRRGRSTEERGAGRAWATGMRGTAPRWASGRREFARPVPNVGRI